MKKRVMVEEMIGKKYGQLEVLEFSHQGNGGRSSVLARCECGTVKTVEASRLISGHTKSCGCILAELKRKYVKVDEVVGNRYGRLKVVGFSHRVNNKISVVECICDCGNEKLIAAYSLVCGNTKSCGCLAADSTRARFTKYTPEIAHARMVFRGYSDGNLTFDQFLLKAKQPCFYCDRLPSNGANSDFIYNGLDRVDSSQSHDLENCVPCCYDCNKAKNALPQKDFYAMVKRIYRHRIRPKTSATDLSGFWF